jgi:hypothetical protein
LGLLYGVTAAADGVVIGLTLGQISRRASTRDLALLLLWLGLLVLDLAHGSHVGFYVWLACAVSGTVIFLMGRRARRLSGQ